jgi:hypothetical protein
MFTVKADRKYWLLGIAAGLSVGILGMLVALLNVDPWFLFGSYIAGPALFGAVFVYCLRSTVGTNWWRGLCLTLGIVAAHWGAFGLAVRAYDGGYLVPAFTYGATFGLVVAALAALLYPPARSARLVAGTVLASGFVALSYLPLQEIVPGGGIFISDTAAWLTFALVYAVVAALLGRRLFVRKTAAGG